jgi:hypothetical protein
MRWTEPLAATPETEMYTGFWMGNPNKGAYLERPRHGRQDNIKEEIGCESVNWIHATQDTEQKRAVVNAAMNLWFPKARGNFLTS